MAQTSKKPASKATGSLWAEALNRASTSTSQWRIEAEEILPLSERRLLDNVTIVKGHSGKPVARITYKDGKVAIFALDWETSQITELGDQLSISSLRLLKKVHQETGDTLLCLKGKVL